MRLAPDVGKLFATVTNRDEMVAVDIGTLKVVSRTPTGRFPDGLAYDAQRHLVAVSNRKDGTETVVDPRSGSVLRTVSIDKEVGDVVYEPVSKAMLVAARPPPAHHLRSRDGLDRASNQASRLSQRQWGVGRTLGTIGFRRLSGQRQPVGRRPEAASATRAPQGRRDSRRRRL